MRPEPKSVQLKLVAAFSDYWHFWSKVNRPDFAEVPTFEGWSRENIQTSLARESELITQAVRSVMREAFLMAFTGREHEPGVRIVVPVYSRDSAILTLPECTDVLDAHGKDQPATPK